MVFPFLAECVVIRVQIYQRPCEERSDEAIQLPWLSHEGWIASLRSQ
jgi:hypothetical protein